VGEWTRRDKEGGSGGGEERVRDDHGQAGTRNEGRRGEARRSPFSFFPSLPAHVPFFPSPCLDGRYVHGIRAVAAGAWHSAALSVAGDVYGWGWDKHGQLGGRRVGEGGGRGGGGGGTVPVPRRLPLSRKRRAKEEEEERVEEEEEDVSVAQIGAGTSYTAALCISSPPPATALHSGMPSPEIARTAPKKRDSLYVWGGLGLTEVAEREEGRGKKADATSEPGPWRIEGGEKGGEASGGGRFLEECRGEARMVCGPYHLLIYDEIRAKSGVGSKDMETA